MARLARVSVPGYCYHVTHRGNRRSRIFFEDEDREVYCALLRKYAERFGLKIWCWCLMTNHVHLIVEPTDQMALSRALGHGHGKYAQWVNARYGLSGHLWSGRFFSTALDHEHLWAAVRYVELNPVRAALVRQAEQWPWSSASAHVTGGADPLLTAGGPLSSLGENWRGWLARGIDNVTLERLRAATASGRPCGDEAFMRIFEEKLNRLLLPQKPGPNRASWQTILHFRRASYEIGSCPRNYRSH